MPTPAAKHSAAYSSARSTAEAEAANWHPKRIQRNLSRYLDTLSIAVSINDLATAYHAAGIIDGLTDLLRPPAPPLTMAISGIGFQFKRYSASSPWESWILPPDDRHRARHHHDQFRDHLAAGRCAALTNIAICLDWSSLHPILTPAPPGPSNS